MLFHSFPFLCLLAVTFLLYYMPLLRRLQVQILILASFVFYSWENPVLISLLLCSILINWASSLGIARYPERRTGFAALGIGANLGLLLFFKYAGLLARTILPANANAWVGWFQEIPLPVGISFFTFQGISLIADTYRLSTSGGDVGSIVAPSGAAHLKKTAFFKSFFPQLVAGPIVKAHQFYFQIGEKRLSDVKWDEATRSLILGYFLKTVVADNMKDQTFWIDYPYNMYYSSLTLAAMLLGYSVQIFADFAGYSLIAIGLAKLFGYNLPVNFSFPYIAQSFSEFWKRWHISLSTWLRDYLYIPLGGNRRGIVFTCLNIMIVMGLGGLWHGAAWSYALWGLYHGVLLVCERLIAPHVPLPRWRVVSLIQGVVVFLSVSGGWLFFRLPDIANVKLFLRSISQNAGRPHDATILIAIGIFSLPVFLYHAAYVFRESRFIRAVRNNEHYVLGALLFMVILNPGPPGKFIYFQF